MLYAFGSNGRGQLSLTHNEDVHTPTPCTLPSSFTRPSTIATGGNHTVIITSTGQAFSVGDNTSSQLCIPPTTASTNTFHAIPPPADNETWALASSGWTFTVLVSSSNRVFVSGHGPKGELGLGATTTALLHPIPGFPPEGTKVTRISSCMAHTLAVLSTGDVYGWGAGRKGQLGTPALAAVPTPRKINVPFPVERAVCGREFSVFLSANDSKTGRRVLLLGNDKYGIRGALGEYLDGVADIEASWSGVYVRYCDGRVVGFGRNDRGQLPPAGLTPVRELVVGSEHVLAVTEKGLVAWGWGEHGNCGKSRSEPGGGDVVGVVEVVEVPGGGYGEVVMVEAGCATSWVWVEGSKENNRVNT